jgi:hypothetical protein
LLSHWTGEFGGLTVCISRRLERVQLRLNRNALLPLPAWKIAPIQPVALHAVLGRDDRGLAS